MKILIALAALISPSAIAAPTVAEGQCEIAYLDTGKAVARVNFRLEDSFPANQIIFKEGDLEASVSHIVVGNEHFGLTHYFILEARNSSLSNWVVRASRPWNQSDSGQLQLNAPGFPTIHCEKK